ncbi:expansin family [Pyrrhoderma noxium]|uniref:Expansin family n=1 Tax=Pyrrhoderma noxium TaxID=2282107 RepID=A0A286UBW9_9AGAM|nr:expansin family [Pyrrhoderma noxium]
MFRILSLVFAFFVAVLSITATPLPANGTNIEKRITHTGRGTWYNPGLGACGETDSDSDDVLAISESIYGSGGNCNQYVHIVNTANGKSAYGKTRDACESCSSVDIDMSPSLFSQIADLDTGEITVEWHFMSKSFSP